MGSHDNILTIIPQAQGDPLGLPRLHWTIGSPDGIINWTNYYFNFIHLPLILGSCLLELIGEVILFELLVVILRF